MLSTTPTEARSSMNRRASAAETSATARSERNMIDLRFRRSTSAPMNGPSRTGGASPSRAAMASTVAEPVCTVSHQMRANCTA